jgi:hypothetical protein
MAGENVIGEAFVAIRPTGQQQFQQETTNSLKQVALGAAAIFGGIKLGQIFGDFISEARESQKVGAQTAAVIKSTGEAARISATQIGKLSTAESNKIGVDDELIQSGANVLLTFTRVRNEVGKGNDVFSQAIKISADMSAALGQDLQSSIIQVGKALQEPISGVTALRRVGVQLSQDQESQIKSYLDVNNVLGAQKVILGELTREFQGSAEAQATDADKAAVAWKNFEESAGKSILPVLDGVLRLGTGLLGLVEGMGGIITIGPALIGIISLIGFTISTQLGVFGLLSAGVGALLLLGNKLGLFGHEVEDTSDNIDGLVTNINRLDVSQALHQFALFQDQSDGVSKKLGNANTSLTAFTRLALASPAAAQRLIDSMNQQGITTQTYDRALAQIIGRKKQDTQATKDQEAANNRLLASLEDVNDATIKAAGGQLGYEQSVLDVRKAQDDLDKVMADPESTVQDKEDATLRLSRAQVDAASTANDNDKAQQDLLATYRAAPGSIDAEIEKLKESQRLHPEIAASYQPMIDKLVELKAKIDVLPPEKPIRLFIDGSVFAQIEEVRNALGSLPGANVGLALLSGTDVTGLGGGARASGGPVGAGTFLVGERGDGAELLTLEPGSRGFVTNAAQTSAAMSGDTYEMHFYDDTPRVRAIDMVQQQRALRAALSV